MLKKAVNDEWEIGRVSMQGMNLLLPQLLSQMDTHFLYSDSGYKSGSTSRLFFTDAGGDPPIAVSDVGSVLSSIRI